MDSAVRITIRVRKYFWKEFVYDVCSALYGAYLTADKVSKRIFNVSIVTLCRRTYATLVKFPITMSVVYKNSILVILLVMFGIGGLVYTMSIPIVLFLAATGRIQ
ncbi:MAG: hypothetical protein AAB557_04470 [Patescibacteria group bacterium]